MLSVISSASLGAMKCESGWENMCLDAIDHHPIGIIFEIILLIYAFCGLAIICDDYLVPALENACFKWSIREDIAGATLLAAGSSAPELIINAITTMQGSENVEMGIGAIIGSGMIAFMFIPALCIILVDQPSMDIKRRPLLRDVSFYLIAVLMLCIFFSDGYIYVYEAICFVLLYVVYVCVVFFAPKIRVWNKLRKMPDDDARKQYLLSRAVSFVEKNQQNQLDQSSKRSINGLGSIEGFNSLQHSLLDSDDEDNQLHHIGSEEYGLDLDIYTSTHENILSDEYTGDENLSPNALDNVRYHVSYNDDEASDSDNEDEEPTTFIGKFFSKITIPLKFVFSYTVPQCKLRSAWDKWYPLGFVLSVIWVALFSLIISSVVSRIVVHSGIPMAFCGIVLVAFGAEIPDIVQSISVARKGYGSMAISNCVGSQIINILLGLGLPWFVSIVARGENIPIPGHAKLFRAVVIEVILIGVFTFLMLGLAVYYNQKKVQLTKWKGFTNLAVYTLGIGAYAFITFCGWSWCSSKM